MPQFTVFGIYEDNQQRWSESFEARDPAHAQTLAYRTADSPLLIAGVIEGSHKCVDRETYGYTSASRTDYLNYEYGKRDSES